MRITRTRDMLSRRMRDGRNPYGSRGGYVVSDRARGRYDRMGDYARSPEHRSRYSDMSYTEPMYEDDRNYSERNYEYDRDYDKTRRVGSFEYDTYRDYDNGDYRLTPKELRTWERNLENADGTRGARFGAEQVKQIAQNLGISFNEFSPELLTTMTNVMYSDYAKAVGTTDIAMFVKMAKAFLCDDDFDGTPDEKAYLYYTSIVEDSDRF